MKQFKVLLISIILGVSFFCFAAFAKNNVSQMNIDVLIHYNGSATITQQWTGTFDEGTEIYIPIEDKSLIVRNLKVSKDGRDYIPTERWDENASFENKSFRSGINKTAKGVELCFGISGYGTNAYTFSYDIDPLVKSYTDADGFNFQFVNPDMSVFPSNVNLRVRLDNEADLSIDNARIWGFGFDGVVYLADGYGIAFTNTALRGSQNIIVMLEIFKGLLRPNVSEKISFEELRENAFVGSTYEETLRRNDSESILFSIIFFGVIGLFAFGGIASVIIKIKRYSQLKKFYKDSNYFRDTPNEGNIAISHILFKDFDIWNSKESNVIGAIIMKMINDKNLEPVQEKSYGFFGSETISTSLKVGPEPKDELIKELYDIIVRAAGEDGILQEKELKNYAKNNYEVLNNYLDQIAVKGFNELNLKDGYVKLKGKNLTDLSDIGKNELSEVYGLRKFLDEFTLISERSLTEGIVWEDLMVYATLFGIAKKVLSELKKLYPDRILEINSYANTYYISDIYFRSLYFGSLNARRAAEAARIATMAAKGFGGSASIGGGGGFSGGGHGGGTR